MSTADWNTAFCYKHSFSATVPCEVVGKLQSESVVLGAYFTGLVQTSHREHATRSDGRSRWCRFDRPL